MRRFKSNKEDVNLPVDDVSLGDVEKDIKDLQSFIANIKSEQDERNEDSNAVKSTPPSKPRVKKPYMREDFESKRQRDLLLFDFPQVNNKVEDIRDTLVQDYIRNLASMNPEEALGSGSLDVRNTDALNEISLQDEREHSGLQYPEHIVERSEKIFRDGSNERVAEPNSRIPGHTFHSTYETGRGHGSQYVHSQHERKPEMPTSKNVNRTKLKTEKKITNSREDKIPKMPRNQGDSIQSGIGTAKKGHRSKLSDATVSSGEERKAPHVDNNGKGLIHDAKGIRKINKLISRMHSRQNYDPPGKHQTRRAETVKGAETSKTQGASKHKNTVSVQKRRGNKYRKQNSRGRSHPNPRRPPPRRPYQPPPTTTELTTTTTTTTESSTWTTQTVDNRTMQEIVDSGVDKIDVPLTDSNTGHAIIHGRRDIVMAGAIMGGIGLLLIILSFVYMFINRRKTQQKITGTAKNNNKSYQRFGTAEETAKLTKPQHSLFPLSSDEDTTEESDEDSTNNLTGIKGPSGKRNIR
ncbi:unnamed protein product [Candidula unifasciata]|uniref:Uncharacterized protein n=1 Tax=Candidula unifasciata TaxID=100452 RepID=A0A8S3YHT1_9EUPU|nr:unnamed protein product [Candidula unifasciata]